jgi:rod shape determining protein RodA
MYFVEKTKDTNYIKQFDYTVFISVFILSVIGIVVLMSAMGINPADPWSTPATMMSWLKQLACLVVGIAIAFVLSAIDYKDFKTLGVILYVFSILLLVLVLIFGDEKYGAKSWLPVPIIGQFQPSELAKVAFVLVIPIFFERLKEGQDKRKNLIKLLVYAAIPILLIFRQPDAGTAAVFMFSFIVMLFIYGLSYKYFFMAIGACAASAPLLWLFVLPEHIKGRILTFLNPEMDLLGKGLQVHRSKMTIGSGQIFGNKLFHGIQTQNSAGVFGSSSYSVPFKQNDFIFSVVGEELGFIGCMAVLLLVYILLLRGLYIAKNSRDPYGTFLAAGIVGIFAFHFIENIGMTIGVLPVTGIPLPFMSQGGSAMLTNYMAIGVLLSVSMRRKKPIFNSGQ